MSSSSRSQWPIFTARPQAGEHSSKYNGSFSRHEREGNPAGKHPGEVYRRHRKRCTRIEHFKKTSFPFHYLPSRYILPFQLSSPFHHPIRTVPDYALRLYTSLHQCNPFSIHPSIPVSLSHSPSNPIPSPAQIPRPVSNNAPAASRPSIHAPSMPSFPVGSSAMPCHAMPCPPSSECLYKESNSKRPPTKMEKGVSQEANVGYLAVKKKIK